MLPSCGATQKQYGNVGATDNKQNRDCSKENIQSSANVPRDFPGKWTYIRLVVRRIKSRVFSSESVQERLHSSVGGRKTCSSPQLDHHPATSGIGDFLWKVDIRAPVPREVGTCDSNNGIGFVIQFECFANDRLIAVEMPLPKTVMQHHDRLRLLAVGGIGRPKIATEQGWHSKGGERLADSVVGNNIFRNLPSGDRQILAIPGGNFLKLVNVSQFSQFRTPEQLIKDLTLLISDAEIAQ